MHSLSYVCALPFQIVDRCLSLCLPCRLPQVSWWQLVRFLEYQLDWQWLLPPAIVPWCRWRPYSFLGHIRQPRSIGSIEKAGKWELLKACTPSLLLVSYFRLICFQAWNTMWRSVLLIHLSPWWFVRYCCVYSIVNKRVLSLQSEVQCGWFC